ncbi:MAG: sugar ABC transporter substrate-binding protein [Lachnospiraceae bacterium]|nr:sugar ABC transporter substrate-binding protein [Lachnospiraceae bacterium]
MKMKKVMALVLAGIMAASLAACGGGSGSKTTEAAGGATEAAKTEAAGGETQAASSDTGIPDFPAGDVSGIKIGFAYRHGSNDTYMTTYYKHAAAYAKEKGLNLVLLDAVDDVTKQTQQVQDLIQQKCDVIIIWPVNSESSVAQAMQVQAAGIPCMTANTDVISDGDQYVTCYVGPSNFEEGYQTGQKACEEMKAEGVTAPKVLYIDGKSGQTTCDERKAGMLKAVEEAGGSFIDAQLCDGLREKAQQITENWLVKFKPGDFDCIMTFDDNSAVGAYNAAKAAGRDTEFHIYGAATGDTSICEGYIKTGLLGYEALQSPLIDSESAINMAANIALGYKPAEQKYFIETPIINKDNFDELYVSWADAE